MPFPPGGGTDIIAREVSQKVAANTGWTFVIDNKPGAGGNLGVDTAAKSPADGYTLVLGQTSNLAINPTLYPKLPYDPQKDLAPVTIEKRRWTTYNFAALWISMAHCIPTYMLASGLMTTGMNWWQALVTILLGNTIVLVPMIPAMRSLASVILVSSDRP